MTIELSNLTFTEQDDIVPASGVDEIVNTGVANTLAGNDTITALLLSLNFPLPLLTFWVQDFTIPARLIPPMVTI